MERAQEIPTHYLKAFMLRGTGSKEGWMKAGPELRSLVHFQRLNLNEAPYLGLGRFDLIFCRNVLIYFDAHSKARVVEQLRNHLLPQGYLFLGHSESLGGHSHPLRAVLPTIYVPR